MSGIVYKGKVYKNVKRWLLAAMAAVAKLVSPLWWMGQNAVCRCGLNLALA